MRVFGDEVRLDPNSLKADVNPGDLGLSKDVVNGLALHTPTGNNYLITAAPEATERLTIFDLCARLCEVPEGQVIPSQETQIEQGRAAIEGYLVRLGIWPPDSIKDALERPEDSPRKRMARGLHK